MIKWIKRKLFYRNLKIAIYDIFEGSTEIFDFVNRLIDSCSDMTGDELRNAVIHSIAELAHEQAIKERETDNEDTSNE